MKSIFDKTTRDELIVRINLLDENSKAQWGTMNINQMLRHCISWDEVAQGKKRVKRTFLSRLLGKMALKGFVKDDSPLKRHLPAVSELKINDSIDSDVPAERNKWISLLNEYPNISKQKLTLPFFGTVKKEQAGHLAYKHSDHHLRQFNV